MSKSTQTMGQAPMGYMPSLESTAGQPAPIAANGGLSYLSRECEGDAGTNAAIEDALKQIAGGAGDELLNMLDNAPPGPIETRCHSNACMLKAAISRNSAKQTLFSRFLF